MERRCRLSSCGGSNGRDVRSHRLIDHTAGRGEAALFYGALCLFVTIAVLRTGKQ